MGTRIRATCDDCGDIELQVDDVEVRICTGDDEGTYLFRCPRCVMVTVKPAERRVVDMLVSSGVRLVEWSLPAEMFERRTGRPFTHDDLLDFHDLLAGDTWFERLLALIGANPADPARD